MLQVDGRLEWPPDWTKPSIAGHLDWPTQVSELSFLQCLTVSSLNSVLF